MSQPHLCRIGDVCTRAGRKKSSIYQAIQRGEFPAPIKRGPRMALWPQHEVDAVLAAEIRGAGEEELRELVGELAAQRATFNANSLNVTE